MSKRGWLGVAVGVATMVGILLAWDALGVTDEERLEAFIDDVTGSVGQGRVSAARARWIDLDRQPFEVSAMGRSLLYREGEEADLAERSRTALAGLRGSDLRAFHRRIDIQGDAATVTLRLVSRGQGMGTVEWRLRKHDDDWLLSRLAVTR